MIALMLAKTHGNFQESGDAASFRVSTTSEHKNTLKTQSPRPGFKFLSFRTQRSASCCEQVADQLTDPMSNIAKSSVALEARESTVGVRSHGLPNFETLLEQFIRQSCQNQDRLHRIKPLNWFAIAVKLFTINVCVICSLPNFYKLMFYIFSVDCSDI